VVFFFEDQIELDVRSRSLSAAPKSLRMPSSCLGAWSWEILAVEFRNGVVANVVLEYFLG